MTWGLGEDAANPGIFLRNLLLFYVWERLPFCLGRTGFVRHCKAVGAISLACRLGMLASRQRTVIDVPSVLAE